MYSHLLGDHTHIYKLLVPLYLRPTAPLVQGIDLGQASTTSSRVKMAASGETTIDFTAPGTNYKGRISHNNTTNALSFFTKASATASFVLADSTAASKIVCKSAEPTTISTEML